MMGIYFLSPTRDGRRHINYDSYDGHVVAARSAHEARELVPSGTEKEWLGDRKFWLTPALSVCERIGTGDDSHHGVILSSLWAG